MNREASSLLKVLDTNSSCSTSNLAPPAKPSTQPAARRVSSVTRVKLKENSSATVPGQSKTEGVGSATERAPIRSEVTPVNDPKSQPQSTTAVPPTFSLSPTSIQSEQIKKLQQKLAETKKECTLILSKSNITDSDWRRMDQIKHEIAIEEVQFQYFMNSLANDSSSSAPYISYDNSQTTMAADAYQVYGAPDPYSYLASSTSLSSSMPPNNLYDECYVADQSTSDALTQTVSQHLDHLGPIPNITPAANADSYDENGDYYGRGKDNFVGPKANKEE